MQISGRRDLQAEGTVTAKALRQKGTWAVGGIAEMGFPGQVPQGTVSELGISTQVVYQGPLLGSTCRREGRARKQAWAEEKEEL